MAVAERPVGRSGPIRLASGLGLSRLASESAASPLPSVQGYGRVRAVSGGLTEAVQEPTTRVRDSRSENDQHRPGKRTAIRCAWDSTLLCSNLAENEPKTSRKRVECELRAMRERFDVPLSRIESFDESGERGCRHS